MIGADIMSTNYKDLLNERLKDADFRKEYEELSPEYEVIKAVLAARKSIDMTQKELAEVSGVAQSDIKMLQRLASGMNMHLKVEFVPNNIS